MKYELDHQDIRDAVVRLCADFPGSYWQACDRDQAYPSEFVKALTEAGYLSALIPEAVWRAIAANLGGCRHP
jgi:acyl-CoA dehydrogenase